MQIITKSAWRRKTARRFFFFHSSLWWRRCVVHTTYSLPQTGVPRGLRAHFINFLFPVGFYFFPGQSNVLLWCVSFRKDKGPVYSTYPCTEDSSDRKASSRLDERWPRWNRSKSESEFVTVRRTETGLQDVNTLVRLLKNIPPLCQHLWNPSSDYSNPVQRLWPRPAPFKSCLHSCPRQRKHPSRHILSDYWLYMLLMHLSS